MSLCISTNLQVETASPIGEDLPGNFVGTGHKEGADAVGRSRAASERERAEDEDVLAERELDEARVGTGFTDAGERVSDREEFWKSRTAFESENVAIKSSCFVLHFTESLFG